MEFGLAEIHLRSDAPRPVSRGLRGMKKTSAVESGSTGPRLASIRPPQRPNNPTRGPPATYRCSPWVRPCGSSRGLSRKPWTRGMVAWERPGSPHPGQGSAIRLSVGNCLIRIRALIRRGPVALLRRILLSRSSGDSGSRPTPRTLEAPRTWPACLRRVGTRSHVPYPFDVFRLVLLGSNRLTEVGQRLVQNPGRHEAPRARSSHASAGSGSAGLRPRGPGRQVAVRGKGPFAVERVRAA